MSYKAPEATDRITLLALELIEKHGVDRYPTVHDNLTKLQEEVGELAGDYLRGKDLSDEIADVEICLRMIAYKSGINIEEAVLHKVNSETRNFVEQASAG